MKQKKRSPSIKDNWFYNIKNHPYIALFECFLFMLGIVAGLVMVSGGESDLNVIAEQAAQGGGSAALSFLVSLLINALMLSVLFLSGIWVPGIIAHVALTIVKGFMFGFSCCFIWHYFSPVSAIILSIVLLIPGILTIASMLPLCVFSTSNWIAHTRSYLVGRADNELDPYIKAFKSLIIPVGVCILIEGLLAPAILTLCSSLITSV